MGTEVVAQMRANLDEAAPVTIGVGGERVLRPFICRACDRECAGGRAGGDGGEYVLDSASSTDEASRRISEDSCATAGDSSTHSRAPRASAPSDRQISMYIYVHSMCTYVHTYLYLS